MHLYAICKVYCTINEQYAQHFMLWQVSLSFHRCSAHLSLLTIYTIKNQRPNGSRPKVLFSIRLSWLTIYHCNGTTIFRFSFMQWFYYLYHWPSLTIAYHCFPSASTSKSACTHRHLPCGRGSRSFGSTLGCRLDARLRSVTKEWRRCASPAMVIGISTYLIR